MVLKLNLYILRGEENMEFDLFGILQNCAYVSENSSSNKLPY